MNDAHDRIGVIRHILSTLTKEDLDRQAIQAYLTKNAHGIESHLNAFRAGLDFLPEEKRTDAIKRHVEHCDYWVKALRDASNVLDRISGSYRTIDRPATVTVPVGWDGSGEKWVDVPGYEGRYKFSNKNRVYTIYFGQTMKPIGKGYNLYDGTKRKYFNVRELRNLCGFEEAA